MVAKIFSPTLDISESDFPNQGLRAFGILNLTQICDGTYLNVTSAFNTDLVPIISMQK